MAFDRWVLPETAVPPSWKGEPRSRRRRVACIAGAFPFVDRPFFAAGNGATFVSRGDDSGTHTKERALRKAVGTTPAGDWYLEAGRGMGEVITMATELLGYALSDRGTVIDMTGKTDLVVATDGDKALFNLYGVIPVNPAKHPPVKHELAQAFAAYLTGFKGQQIVASFRKSAQQLFFTY